MTTSRRFCRFSRAPATASFSVTEIPEDGLCLSAFVLLSPKNQPSAVLLGHMNPEAPWDHIGALDPERVELHGHRWMIPSSHLIYGESPPEAARRVLREQLGLESWTLQGPRVVSEVYAPRRSPAHPGHWDIEFLFWGTGPDPPFPSVPAWRDLAYVDTLITPVQGYARAHEDVLRSAGFPVPG